MAESARPNWIFACSGIVAVSFPAGILIPIANLLLIPGIGALYLLWFSRAYVPFAIGSIVAAAAILLLGSSVHLTVFLVMMMIPGLTIAALRRDGRGMALSLAAAFVLPVAFFATVTQAMPLLVESFSDQLRAMTSQPGMAMFYSQQDLDMVASYFGSLADKAPYYVPALIACSLGLIYLLGTLLGETFVRRNQIYSFRIPPFSLWKLDEWMIIPLGIAVVMILTSEATLLLIGWNALLALFVIFTVVGLGFVEYGMKIKNFPVAARIAVYILLFLAQIVAAIVLPLLALFDARFDFRKIRAKQLG